MWCLHRQWVDRRMYASYLKHCIVVHDCYKWSDTIAKIRYAPPITCNICFRRPNLKIKKYILLPFSQPKTPFQRSRRTAHINYVFCTFQHQLMYLSVRNQFKCRAVANGYGTCRLWRLLLRPACHPNSMWFHSRIGLLKETITAAGNHIILP